MSFSVKVNDASLKRLQKKLEGIAAPLKKGEADELGKQVVIEMKNLIRKGVSPITGKRFAQYKKSYKEQIKKYHSKAHGKKQTPVNLHLTGEFLSDLINTVVTSNGTYAARIGFKSKESEKKEQGHREGANGQRKRPIIPQAREKFAQRIQNIIILFTRDALRKIIRSS